MKLGRLRQLVSPSTQVIILADREFGTLNNMYFIKKHYYFDYILRIKRNFTLTDKHKHTKKLAYQWLADNSAVTVDDGYITLQAYPVKKVIVCKDIGMKELWCLACSIDNIATQTILNYYAKRWGTETSYRDEKDLQFGLGLKKARIRCCGRRDRALLLSAIAIIFLTLLGAACESTGFTRYIKSNTVSRRTHSLPAQGRILLRLLPTMRTHWRSPIWNSFLALIQSIDNITSVQFVL